MSKIPVDTSRDLYIAWVKFQRRALSMQEILGFELRLVPPPFSAKWLKPAGYVWQTLRTAGLVLSRRPRRVWVQSPPTFIPHILVLLRLVRPFEIIADTHHEALIAPWGRLPGALTMLNRCDRVLVHNAESLAEAERLGVERGRLLVVEDPPPPNMLPGPHIGAAPAPYILVPCSFKSDEPIDTLLDAARLLPEVEFRVTGNRARAEAKGFVANAPPNVNFTGFVPAAQYDETLQQAAVVLGLTSEEGIQLSVANEALGAGRALVLSRTRVLQSMFADAALFSANTAQELSETLREALASRARLEEKSKALRARRLADWTQQIASIQPL